MQKLTSKDKIKLCIVVPTSYPAIGGYENLVYSITRVLSEKVEVHVVCSKLNTLMQIPKGVKVHVLPPIIKTKYVGFIVNSMVTQIRLYFLARKEQFDIIHAHPSFPSGFYCILTKLFLRIPIVCTSHGEDIQIDWRIGYGVRRNRIISWLIKVILKNVDVHTVVSKCMIKDAIDAGSNPSRIHVIYNGIDLNNIPRIYDHKILEKHEIQKDDFIVIFLSRLHPKKCPEDLLRAFPKVLKEVPNAKLVFAGKGKEEEKLKRLARKLNIEHRIIFTGFVSEAEKWSLLKRCDVFVLPSVVEAFGIAVIEAMACGKPVIATNVGPFPEIIKDGETGILVPAHSPTHLAHVIINLARDERMRENMGKRAREDVEDRFDINKIARDYLKVYEDVKGRRMRK
jgi:N-acetyl-alpha-D-glucosaminyl L-malate synthase BshA